MSNQSPFAPAGQGFIITTSSSTSTSQTTQVLLIALGFVTNGAMPIQFRVLNRGSADVWFSVTAASATAVLPVAGTTTVGTPGGPFWAVPGVDLVLTHTAGWSMVPVVAGYVGQTYGSTTILPGSSHRGLYINTISASASQNLYVQFGDGA